MLDYLTVDCQHLLIWDRHIYGNLLFSSEADSRHKAPCDLVLLTSLSHFRIASAEDAYATLLLFVEWGAASVTVPPDL